MKKKQRGPKENKKKATFIPKKANLLESSSDKPGNRSREALDYGPKENRADAELDKLISNKSARKYPTSQRRNK